jgi:cytochrome c peroxidase
MHMEKKFQYRSFYTSAVLSVVIIVLLCVACKPPGQKADGSPDFTPEELQKIYALSPLPSPPTNPGNRYADSPEAAHFGQYLFFDPRLSQNQKINCASCHNPGLGWSDQRSLAQGLGKGTRHSPSLWNVSHQRWLFWDGRADSVWSQAMGPLQSAHEMGATPTLLMQRFQQQEDLRRGYEAVFGSLPQSQSPVQQQRFMANIGKALEAYQRKIVSTESPFDTFVKKMRQGTLESETPVLSLEAQRGLRLFIGAGQCILCHQGPLLSDSEFHNIGLPALPGAAVDEGRLQGVGLVQTNPFNGKSVFSDTAPQNPVNDKLNYLKPQESQRGAFRTPSLREVSTTAPYMHDGRFKTLAEVIQFYNAPVLAPAIGEREDTLQPLRLTPEDAADLEAFLKTLTSGPSDSALVVQPASPVLPASK